MPTEFVTNKSTRTVVQKSWGSEEWIINNHHYCGKLLYLKAGYQGSLHYHPIKDETFMCLAGVAKVEFYPDDPTCEGPAQEVLLRGWERDAVHLSPCTPHRFSAPTGEDALLVEFSTPHNDDDVRRIQPGGKTV